MSTKKCVEPRIDVPVIVEARGVEHRSAAEDGRHSLDGCQLQLTASVILDGPVPQKQKLIFLYFNISIVIFPYEFFISIVQESQSAL